MSVENINVQSVANAFVKQYYHFFLNCPEVVHKFYQESSLLGWPGADDAITSVTTLEVSYLGKWGWVLINSSHICFGLYNRISTSLTVIQLKTINLFASKLYEELTYKHQNNCFCAEFYQCFLKCNYLEFFL